MERKYQMSRISAGDYLLPSNDATVLFRISQYDDVDDDKPVKVWCVYVFDTPIANLPDELPDDFLEWERWREISFFHRTRQVAIDDALSTTPDRRSVRMVFGKDHAKLVLDNWPT